MKLSIGIITKNEERNLKISLEAIHDIADEIIIIDNGSTDSTEEVALSYNAKFFIEKWKGYGKQKNSVLDKCTGDWILLIDADEVVSPELKAKIKDIISNDTKNQVFALNRCSVCFGKEIKHGGWSNEFIPRLWKNGSVRVSEDDVHENYLTEESTSKIKEKLLHYTYHNLEEYFVTFNQYTSLNAKKYQDKNRQTNLLQFTLKPGFAFFKRYILRLGFLDGIEGLLLARLASIYVFTKYYKLKQRNEQDNG